MMILKPFWKYFLTSSQFFSSISPQPSFLPSHLLFWLLCIAHKKRGE
jgi:hypothetical protein